MRVVLIAVLVGHAVAHVVGFVVPWQLMTSPEIPYRTTAMGGLVDLGSTGARVLGVAWLAMAVTFAVMAGGLLWQAPWWPPATLIAVGISMMLCVFGWPDARIGLLANALILALLAVDARWAALS
jgi:hypothetical protein